MKVVARVQGTGDRVATVRADSKIGKWFTEWQESFGRVVGGGVPEGENRTICADAEMKGLTPMQI